MASHLKLDETLNKDHVTDVNYAVKYSKWFFKMLGLYPDVISNPTSRQRIVWRFVVPIPTLAVLCWTLPLIAHVATRDLSTAEIVGCLGPMIYQTTNILKNHVLIVHRKSLKFCIQHMETDWRRIENEGDREIMRRNLKVGHKISFICIVSMYGGALFFNSVPLFTGSYVNELNETVRPLALPGADVFVDLNVGYNYEVVVCFNWLSVFYLNTIVTAICDLTAILVAHTCGQVQIVVARIEGLIGPEEECDAGVIRRRIAFIVDSHVRALRFAAKIDQLLQEICMLEALCATLLISWLEYTCMKNLENSGAFELFAYSFLLVSFCFNIFIFCHIGENLKDQFEEVGRVAYMLEWYRLPEKTGLAMMMLIMLSKNPPRLTAGQMMELSYNSFGNIMQTSFAYLNMLRQMGV